MTGRPHVVHASLAIGTGKVAALLTLDTGPEIVRGLVEVSEVSTAMARLGRPALFLEELARELCRVGMHYPACGCVRIRVSAP